MVWPFKKKTQVTPRRETPEEAERRAYKYQEKRHIRRMKMMDDYDKKRKELLSKYNEAFPDMINEAIEDRLSAVRLNVAQNLFEDVQNRAVAPNIYIDDEEQDDIDFDDVKDKIVEAVLSRLIDEDLSPGRKIHLGLAQKGGAGVTGRVTKVDGDIVHIESEKAGKFGKRTWKGPVKNASSLDETTYDKMMNQQRKNYNVTMHKFQDGRGPTSSLNVKARNEDEAKHIAKTMGVRTDFRWAGKAKQV